MAIERERKFLCAVDEPGDNGAVKAMQLERLNQALGQLEPPVPAADPARRGRPAGPPAQPVLPDPRDGFCNEGLSLSDDLSVAQAMLLAVPDKVTSRLKGLKTEIDKLAGGRKVDLDQKERLYAEEPSKKPPGLGPLWTLSTEINTISPELQAAPAMLGLADGAAELAVQGLTALAKVILDRAQREAIGWLLDRMAHEVCQDDAGADPSLLDPIAKREIRTHWAPSLCNLARGDRLLSYGAGSALVTALRAAMLEDVRHLPAAAGGLALGALYARVAGTPASSVFGCDTDGDVVCRVRDAGETLVTGLISGRNAPQTLAAFGQRLQAALPPVDGKSAGNVVFRALACASALPATLQGAFEENTDAPASAAAAGTLAGIVQVQACKDLLSVDGDAMAWLRDKGPKALDALRALGASWQHLNEELERLKTAFAKTADLDKLAAGGTAAAAPLAPTDAEAVRASVTGAEELLAGRIRAVQTTLAGERLRAALAVADAALDFTQNALGALGRAATALGLPVNLELDKITAGITTVRRVLSSADAIAAQDWAALLVRGIKLAEDAVAEACPETTCTHRDLLAPVARFSGTISALLSAKDADAMAEALDAAAEPIGTGLLKSRAGRFTLSLTSHAGFLAGAETRWGQYGVERVLGKAAPVVPALSLPFGVDLAWGLDGVVSPVGLYLSLLDPAGFLQYDTTAEALPKPRITTAVALGAGLRIGFAETPFSLVAMTIFRPSYRSFDTASGEPGAHVWQFLAGPAVDVTLWTLHAR
ncbi:MAG: hypothetical protein IT373_36300 [Polyangiaceae bacterium]|nr:hypothetical protein [Polyangiaceae bacterium]